MLINAPFTVSLTPTLFYVFLHFSFTPTFSLFLRFIIYTFSTTHTTQNLIVLFPSGFLHKIYQPFQGYLFLGFFLLSLFCTVPYSFFFPCIGPLPREGKVVTSPSGTFGSFPRLSLSPWHLHIYIYKIFKKQLFPHCSFFYNSLNPLYFSSG